MTNEEEKKVKFQHDKNWNKFAIQGGVLEDETTVDKASDYANDLPQYETISFHPSTAKLTLADLAIAAALYQENNKPKKPLGFWERLKRMFK